MFEYKGLSLENKWVFGEFTNEIDFSENKMRSFILNNDEKVQIVPYTLCTNTKLKDFDGNFIFEKDIVEILNKNFGSNIKARVSISDSNENQEFILTLGMNPNIVIPLDLTTANNIVVVANLEDSWKKD